MIYTIEKNGVCAKINSLGAELISFVGKDGYEYMWQGDIWAKHAPVLFPLCGKIKNNEYTYKGKKYSLRGRGFAPKAKFRLIDKSEDKLILRLTENEETLACYPFEFSLTAEYLITEDGLSASYTVENTGKDTLPYMFGWHPAFNLWGKAPISDFRLYFPAAGRVKMHPLALERGPFVNGEVIDFPLDGGSYYLNEEEIYSNDTLILTNSGDEVVLSAKGEERELTMSYSGNLPYFCVWKSETSEARFLCLEPWSNSPCDGIADEDFETRVMERLPVGKSEKYTYEISVK